MITTGSLIDIESTVGSFACFREHTFASLHLGLKHRDAPDDGALCHGGGAIKLLDVTGDDIAAAPDPWVCTRHVGQQARAIGDARSKSAAAAAYRVESAWLSRVSSTRVSTAKPENLRASTTKLPTVRRSAPAEPPVLGANSGGFFGRPPGFPLRPFTNQPLPVRFTAHFQPVFKPRSQILNLRRPDINLLGQFSTERLIQKAKEVRENPQLTGNLKLWWNKPRG